MKTTDHTFEIPWNNDTKLLDCLNSSSLRNKVQCIYLPCADSHGKCTCAKEGINYSEYDIQNHVAHIKDAGFNPCILMQRNFDLSYLPFYVDMGIRYFTVGEDRVAESIRERLGDDAYIIASVTKDLMNDDYEMYSEMKPELYNIFILRLGYSRDIEAIMNLPKNLKYGIMPNLVCLWNCPNYRQHWFPDMHESFNNRVDSFHCEDVRCNENGDLDLTKSMYIPSSDLWAFDPLVNMYKLTHRTEITENIMDHITAYSNVDITPPENNLMSETLKKYNIGHGRQYRCGKPIY